MQLHLPRFWLRFHWIARFCALAVIAAILVWHARYGPVLGWPLRIDDLWSNEHWQQSIFFLFIDGLIWFALAVSTASVLDRACRGIRGSKFSLRTLFLTQAGIALAIAAVLLAAWAENSLLARPNNGIVIFDVGLFIDPIGESPWIRLPIIFAFACMVYSCFILLCRLPGINAHTSVPSAESPAKTPAAVEFIEWLAIVLLALLAAMFLFGPGVY